MRPSHGCRWGFGRCGRRWGEPTGELSAQSVHPLHGLMDSGGDTLSLPPVRFVPITHGDLIARSLMWFVLGGWRNESYSVAFSEEECVI